jgi:lipopolysaccharide transport system permease protein
MQQKNHYYPNKRQDVGILKTWAIMIGNIIRSRELIYQLFKRDFFMAYKKSFLGFTWIIAGPIIGIASWVFLQYTNVLNPGDTGIPFPVFVLVGASIWGLFMGFYGSAAGTLGAGASFIMQVNYPHEVLLIKQTAQHLANFIITFILNIFVLLLFQVIPDWKIIFFPLIIIPIFFLAAGLGLLMSISSVVAADLNNIMNIILGFVFYLTPIIYVQNAIQSEFLSKLVELNPLTYLVGGARDLILYGEMQYLDRFILVSILSFVFFMFTWRLFYVSEEKVIEKMI